MNKKKKKKSHVPFRLNMLFLVVFVLFSVLILRLGVVQIVYGDDFKREVERTEDITVNYPVPRGKMYDRYGKVVVNNVPLNAITYTKYQGTKQEEMIDTAEKLAKLINMGSKKDLEKKLPLRDKKDIWIIRHAEEAKKKITKKEWDQYYNKKLDDDDIYKLQLERITDKEINALSYDDLEVLAIFREFNRGYAQTPQIVKNKNVTPEEFARVSENLESLPGVDTTTDWDREYPFSSTLKSVLGKVTSANEGLPQDQLDYYLSRGYNRNDRVGKSYIEMQYENILSGQKAKVRNKTDKSGYIISSEVISEGQRGKDLVLTIDMDLQMAVEQIIEEHLLAAKKKPRTDLLDRAYVVLMDPNTGEILTMAGKRLVQDKNGKTAIQDDALGNISTSYNVGSAVKGATVLTGYKTGAIKPGTVFIDSPLYIAGTPVKKSWSSSLHGPMSDLNALKRSSNVYMWHTAIKIGKGKYIPHGGLPLDTTAFNTMRDSFSQFGLGVRTGIDLPNETVGFKGAELKPGFLLDFAIGQYDTYSNMQLAQYVSTIANDGKRLKPHIVKSIHDPVMENNKLGPLSMEMTPTILNILDMEEDWIKRVQEGFRQVMQESQGTAVSFFRSKPYKPAGKTGTAEALYDGPRMSELTVDQRQTINLSLIGYAPHDNPEVAMAVLVPWAYQGGSGHYMNNQVGAAVLDAYFKLKNEREAKLQAEALTHTQTEQNVDIVNESENNNEENQTE